MVKVRLVGLRVTEAVAAAPVPDNATSCGLLRALLTKWTLAVRLPVVVGVKVTATLQEALTARDEGQELTMPKSPGFVPVRVTPIPVSVAVPLLVSVSVTEAVEEPTVCEPKVIDVGANRVAPAVPVPVRLTVWGLPEALSVIERVPFLFPTAVGVKVTLNVQLAFTARAAPQVVVLAKSPLADVLLIVRLAVPLFVKVTV